MILFQVLQYSTYGKACKAVIDESESLSYL